MINFLLEADGNLGGGNAMMTILMFGSIFAIFYFFMIRPQQKQRKEIQKFQNELKEGSQVVTGGGIYGTVTKIDLVAGKISIKIATDVVITVDKNYVFKDASSGMPQN
jgi:preprotein translocase subunit YajC